MPLHFISTISQLQANIEAFRDWIQQDPAGARELLRRSHYLVVEPSPFAVAPSKYCAYNGMTRVRYPHASSESGAPFSGSPARFAIESVVGDQFAPHPETLNRATVWLEGLLPGVTTNMDTSKWYFLSMPAEVPAAPVNAPDGEAQLGDWPSYAASEQGYLNYWHAFNDALYEMVAARPAHTHLPDVVAKVGIIGRAYATQIERQGSRDGDGAIIDVAGAIHAVGPEFDQRIHALSERAGGGDQLSLPTLTELVGLHAWVGERVSSVLRNENAVPSFVSKYLHFHLPATPIYDSRARIVLNGFYPAYGNQHRHLPFIRRANVNYVDFCNRFWSLWCDAVTANIHPSTKRLDQYLLYCHEIGAWNG